MRVCKINPTSLFYIPFILVFLGNSVHAEEQGNKQIIGAWTINEELSDDTDKQVEKAIKKSGGKLDNNKKGKERYRGGPEDQELYDRMSYDQVLYINYVGEEFHFTYADGFSREFFSDGRSRVISASGSQRGDDKDYSFAAWEGEVLNIESRPRDGGVIYESYSITPEGQLRAELSLKPASFPVPVEIIRIYDRK